MKVDQINFQNQLAAYDDQLRFMVDERRNYEEIFETFKV